MNVLTRILMAAAKAVNAENGIKLKKIAEFGDEDRGAGVYHDKDYSEYRVMFIGDGAHLTKADYHTSDLDDAMDTARTCTAPNEPERAEPVATEEEPRALPTRPRGYYAQPSGLLNKLLARA